MTDRAEIERPLINGRTPEEIKRVLEWQAFSCGGFDCDKCPWRDICTVENRNRALTDALAMIERLESERDAALAKVPKWTGVRERLPERHVPVLGLIEKYGSKARINNVVIWDGISWARDTGVYYEDPAGEVTHWMPLPEPPEEG